MHTIKCVVVGDGGVGKTCLLYTYINEHFPADDAFKTAHESCKGTVKIGGEPYTLSLLDTSGQEHTDRLRISISYKEADVFLVCFNVVAPASLDSVKNMWVPEITKECPNKPFLLVGTQVDLRDDTSTITKLQKRQQEPITQEQGVKLARELRAVKYVECSALTQHGLDNVFHGAIRAVWEARKAREPPEPSKKKKGCVLS